MSKVTFIAFSANDQENEQKRVSIFIQSLLQQTDDRFQILFFDCSDVDRRFVLPADDRLQVEYFDSNGEVLNPTYIRNLGAVKANTPYIAHVNADNYYSNNIVATIIEFLDNNDGQLLLCRKYKTTQQQCDNVNDVSDLLSIPITAIKRGGKRGCGDFQALSRQHFIEMGGYYDLISDNIVEKGDFKHRGVTEDVYLRDYCILGSRGKKSMKVRAHTFLINPEYALNVMWIDTLCTIIHMWHPMRGVITQHMERYRKNTK